MFVFGGVEINLLSEFLVIVLLISSVLLKKSTSSQVNANASPFRIPVKARTLNRE